jgi:hypothetical protein
MDVDAMMDVARNRIDAELCVEAVERSVRLRHRFGVLARVVRLELESEATHLPTNVVPHHRARLKVGTHIRRTVGGGDDRRVAARVRAFDVVAASMSSRRAASRPSPEGLDLCLGTDTPTATQSTVMSPSRRDRILTDGMSIPNTDRRYVNPALALPLSGPSL